MAPGFTGIVEYDGKPYYVGMLDKGLRKDPNKDIDEDGQWSVQVGQWRVEDVLD
jgi:hypothetical protein